MKNNHLNGINNKITEITERLALGKENYDFEIKSWIDPTTNECIAKIVKAVLALYNSGGGYLLIGYDDKSFGEAAEDDEVKVKFKPEYIQTTIIDYSSEKFELELFFYEGIALSHPCIIVPTGVTCPAVVTRELSSRSQENTKLLSKGDFYIRTYESNNSISSARITNKNDYERFLCTAFGNKELDHVTFIKRNFADKMPDIVAFLKSCGKCPYSYSAQKDNDSSRSMIEELPNSTSDLEKEAKNILKEGKNRYEERITNESSLTQSEKEFLAAYKGAGSYSCSLIIKPTPSLNGEEGSSFLDRIGVANPNHTGWPPWLDSRGCPEKSFRPYYNTTRAWETFILANHGGLKHGDFTVMYPTKGSFYLRRFFADDIQHSLSAKVFDPYLMLYRVGEIISVGLSFAKELGVNGDNGLLGFIFHWSGLKGRKLEEWCKAEPGRMFVFHDGRAIDNEVTTFIKIPACTSVAAIDNYILQATKDLYLAFDGYEVSKNKELIESVMDRLLKRR